ncbi:MAG: ATP-grasp domain-containing protein [Candidatus Omnitrophota bacterium]|jgi:predicted ATP-grasp superfamily ATP-dependent carboligase
MVKKIYILGNHIQALGIAQIAGRLGLEIILFTDNRLSLARFSRYCKKTIVFSDKNELLKKLIHSHSGTKEVILMPTNDGMVEFLMDNYQTLNNIFFISLPQVDITEICFNKILTYKKLRELNIPFPDSRYPQNVTEAKAAAQELGYPIIIKPAIMFKFVDNIGEKVLVCRNDEELTRNYELAVKHIHASNVIVQKIIAGGAKNLYSFGSFSVSGKVISGFVVNRCRQRPMNFGFSTTFARSIACEEVERLSIEFLQGINYFGLSEIEFMYDEEDKKYKLLEINPRTWKWHSIANKLDINLIKMLIDYFEKKELCAKFNRNLEVAWIDPFTDFFMAIEYLLKGQLSIKGYFGSLMMKKEIAIFSPDDILPAIIYIVLLPYLIYSKQ